MEGSLGLRRLRACWSSCWFVQGILHGLPVSREGGSKDQASTQEVFFVSRPLLARKNERIARVRTATDCWKLCRNLYVYFAQKSRAFAIDSICSQGLPGPSLTINLHQKVEKCLNPIWVNMQQF